MSARGPTVSRAVQKVVTALFQLSPSAEAPRSANFANFADSITRARAQTEVARVARMTSVAIGGQVLEENRDGDGAEERDDTA